MLELHIWLTTCPADSFPDPGRVRAGSRGLRNKESLSPQYEKDFIALGNYSEAEGRRQGEVTTSQSQPATGRHLRRPSKLSIALLTPKGVPQGESRVTNSCRDCIPKCPRGGVPPGLAATCLALGAFSLVNFLILWFINLATGTTAGWLSLEIQSAFPVDRNPQLGG